MAENYIRTTNFWSAIKNTYVKHDGVWERVNKQYIKESGAWQQIFDSTTDSFLLEFGSTSSTTYGSVTTERTAHATIDREENILIGIVNYYFDSTRSKIAIISKWSPTGNLIWEQSFDTTQSCDSCLIDTDSDNNVYFLVREASNPRMYKLSKTDGSIIWQQLYASVTVTYDFAINGNDDIIIGGYTNYSCGGGANRQRFIHKKISKTDGSILSNGGGAPGNCLLSGASAVRHITTDGTDFYAGGVGGYTNSVNIGQGVFGTLVKIDSSNSRTILQANWQSSICGGPAYCASNRYPESVHGNMTSLISRTPSNIGHAAVNYQQTSGYKDFIFLNSSFGEISNGSYRISDSDGTGQPNIKKDALTYRDGIVYCASQSASNYINIFALSSYGTILWNNVLTCHTKYDVNNGSIARINYHNGRIILVTVSANSNSKYEGNFSGNVVQVWKLPARQMTDTIRFGDGTSDGPYRYEASTAITVSNGGSFSSTGGFPGLSNGGYGGSSETPRSTLSVNKQYYRYYSTS